MAVYSSGMYIDPTTQEVAAALAWLSPAELERIVAARGVDLARTGQRDDNLRRNLIAVQLTAAAEVSAALQRLALSELTVLRVLWRSGAAVRAASIATAFAGLLDGPALARCLARLQDLALLLPIDRKGESVFVPSSVRAALLGRAGAPRPAAYIYESLSSNTLADICAGLGLAVLRNRKADRLSALLAAVQDEGAVRQRLAALPEQARRVFDEVVAAGGTMDGWRLAQKFPGAGISAWGYSGYDYQSRRRGASENPVVLLQGQGLLAPFPGDYATSYTIADETLTALLPPLQVSPADFVESALVLPSADARPAGANLAPLLDLAETLHFIDENAPTLTQKNLFPRPQSKRLARLLSVQDTAFADLLILLALHLRLVENDDSRLRVRPKKVAALLKQAEGASRAVLFAAWQQLRGWRDDREEGLDRGEAGVMRDGGDRAVLLEQLMALPEAGATIDSLAARLWYRAPLRFGALRPASATAGDDKFMPTAFVLGALRSLTWLGLAEALHAPGKASGAVEVVGLRLTAAGQALLHSGPTSIGAAVPRTDRIIVQPTLDLLVQPNIEPTLYGTLRRFSDFSGAAGMRTLTLTPASLRRALDRGMAPVQVRDLLEQHSAAPLPATVDALLAEVQSRHGRIHVGPAAYYLTVDDPHLLVELQSDRRLAGLIVRTLAPTVALVHEQSLPAILERLRGSGHMPVADTPGQAAPATPNGQLAPVFTSNRRLLSIVPGTGGRAPAEPEAYDATEPVETEKAHGSDAIRALLEDAIARRTTVELEYRAKMQGVEQRTVREIEVNDIYGNIVVAFCRTKMAEREFKLERIVWARLTGDRRRTRRPAR